MTEKDFNYARTIDVPWMMEHKDEIIAQLQEGKNFLIPNAAFMFPTYKDWLEYEQKSSKSPS